MSLEELNLDNIEMAEADVPTYDEAGLPVLGDKPVVGAIRRSQGVPVVREEVAEELDL